MEESLQGLPILSSEFILILQPFGSTLVSKKIRGIRGTFNQSATDILELCDGTRKVIDIKKELKDKYPFRYINSFIDELSAKGIIYTKEKTVPQTKGNIIGNKSKTTPVYVFIEITRKCSLRCKYCFNESGISKAEELGTKEWLKIFDMLKRNGTQIIAFSGGDIFSRLDAWTILEYAINNFYVVLLTNGNFVNSLDKRKEKLLSRLASIQISLDSVTPKHHDYWRGVGSWETAIKAIKKMLELGVKTSIAATIMPENFDQITKLRDFAVSNGASIDFSALTIKGRAKSIERPSSEFYKNVEKARVVNAVGLQTDAEYINHEERVVFPCGPIAGRITINAKGLLKPCPLSESLPESWSPNFAKDTIFDLFDKKIDDTVIYKEIEKIAKVQPAKEFVNVTACGECKYYYSECQKGCVVAPYYMKDRVINCVFRDK